MRDKSNNHKIENSQDDKGAEPALAVDGAEAEAWRGTRAEFVLDVRVGLAVGKF